MTIVGFGGGFLLGLLYFFGLWYTVERLVKSRQPHIPLVLSIAVRFGLLFLGLYFVSAGDVVRLLAALLGVVAARLTVTQFVAYCGRSNSA